MPANLCNETSTDAAAGQASKRSLVRDDHWLRNKSGFTLPRNAKLAIDSTIDAKECYASHLGKPKHI